MAGIVISCVSLSQNPSPQNTYGALQFLSSQLGSKPNWLLPGSKDCEGKAGFEVTCSRMLRSADGNHGGVVMEEKLLLIVMVN
jgi:hypothetical protein